MAKKVIGFHYKLTVGGKEIESSFGTDSPLYFLEDAQNIIPGLEKEIMPLKVDEEKSISVVAAEAYGETNEELIVEVQRSQFPAEANIKEDDQFQLDDQEQSPVFLVKKIEGETVYLDGNHPMVGKDLTFDVKVLEVRDATDEELAHGHAHGP
ncbi:MAG: FKBP-type peptidyl-prolyl cis-trans isomerase SlyD, partial [Thermoproteota archaeon]